MGKQAKFILSKKGNEARLASKYHGSEMSMHGTASRFI